MAERPVRKPTRYPGYDYRDAGPYFITICEYHRVNRFGIIADGRMHLNAAGRMVLDTWRSVPSRFAIAHLDVAVVMPNHFHALVTLGMDNIDQNTSLTAVVQWFKTVTTTRYIRGVKRDGWPPYDGHLWQRSFHDRIVRTEREWARMFDYIEHNPALWTDDVFYEP